MPTISDDFPAECRADEECRRWLALRALPELLEAVSQESGTELAVQTRLRQRFPADLVPTAIQLHVLRCDARQKFRLAGQMWFDRIGFEQSTSEVVARHKALRFPEGEAVTDLCSGIGGDALALAERHRVCAVDLRPAACLLTRWNAEVYGVAEQVNVEPGDVLPMPLRTDWIHIDPDRRAGGGSRANRLEEYVPDLDWLRVLATRVRGGAIKVGPASNFGGKFPGTEIELVSVRGECKEATVWFGELAGPHPCRATVFPEGASLAGHPLSAAVAVTPLKRYLYDPDPAVVRAGLVDLCAEQLGLTRLDAAEEYLTSDQRVASPFVTAFRVVTELPNNDRELRQALRGANYGVYEIKCRHIPVQAEALRRGLPVQGTETATIVVARLNGRARRIVAERC